MMLEACDFWSTCSSKSCFETKIGCPLIDSMILASTSGFWSFGFAVSRLYVRLDRSATFYFEFRLTTEALITSGDGEFLSSRFASRMR